MEAENELKIFMLKQSIDDMVDQQEKKSKNAHEYYKIIDRSQTRMSNQDRKIEDFETKL